MAKPLADLLVNVVDERFQRCGIGRSASKAVAIRALQLMFAQVGPTNRRDDLSVNDRKASEWPVRLAEGVSWPRPP